jgi:hypothetical protein
VPVLLGLIGLDGDNNELEKKLAGDMVPVGKAAPWKVASWKVAPHVIEMYYDPDNPDQDSGTPCPGLTHLVFFQQRDDMREFRDLLRKLIPELLLMFGPATSYANLIISRSLPTYKGSAPQVNLLATNHKSSTWTFNLYSTSRGS